MMPHMLHPHQPEASFGPAVAMMDLAAVATMSRALQGELHSSANMYCDHTNVHCKGTYHNMATCQAAWHLTRHSTQRQSQAASCTT
jgi:hypothetical protein